MAYHDENGNGKLDKNFIGIPKEGYGFSRQARGRYGPPAFEHAVFELHASDAEQSLNIEYRFFTVWFVFVCDVSAWLWLGIGIKE